MYLPFQLINIYAQDSFALFHIPVGTLLVCGSITLLSEGGTRVRLFLLFGMVTHCALDVLFTEVSGRLPYPVSWETWQLVLNGGR